jgi:hypothetical protein
VKNENSPYKVNSKTYEGQLLQWMWWSTLETDTKTWMQIKEWNRWKL